MRGFVHLDSVSDPSSINEDRIGLHGALAWILDGASPATRVRVVPTAESDASWLVDAWDSYLRKVSNDDSPLVELVTRGIDAVSSAASREWTAEPDVEPSTTLTVVRHAGDHIDFFVLGDSPLVFIMDEREQAITDDRPDTANRHLLEEVIDDARLKGSFQLAREARLFDLAAQRRAQMNRLDGYWVIARNRSAATQGLSGSVGLPKRVLLASDGFARAVSTFGLSSNYRELLSSRESLTSVVSDIRRAENADPLCTAHPRWSVHDDASALLIAPD